MPDFFALFPDRLDVLELDAPDLAAILLEYFHSISDIGDRGAVMCASFIRSQQMVPAGPRRHDVSRALIEAWCWLIHEGFVVPYPLQPKSDQYDFSRLGLAVKDRRQVAEYQRRLRCPRGLLHKTLVEKAWPIFLRGEFDTAVFQAFKEVEVSVREAGRYNLGDYGQELMRKAFKPTNEKAPGALSDGTEPDGEQKALQDFFTGAFGRARNPTAHRHGVLNDPEEAFELTVVASHLLRIVDRRRT